MRASAWLDAFLFSSLATSLAAAGLLLAVAEALGLPGGHAAALAFGGTLAVYNVDRLRDVERDERSWPRRSRFVKAHRRWLVAATFLASVAAAGLALRGGAGSLGLCAAVLALGLFHRRLKGHLGFEVSYVAAAWTAVVVGLPLLANTAATVSGTTVAWLVAVVGGSLAANALASCACDTEGERPGAVRGLGLARGLALGCTALAWGGPEALRPLAWIPLSQFGALLFFRRSEVYALGVLDGSLALGAGVAILGLG